MSPARRTTSRRLATATCAALFAAGCSTCELTAPPVSPADDRTPRPAPTTVVLDDRPAYDSGTESLAPGYVKMILTDLWRWDAVTAPQRRAAAEDVARRLPDFALLRLETFSCGGQTHEVALYRHAKTGMEFVLVPGGTFLMGSPERERFTSETQHAVRLTRPFLICRTECTQAAYERVVGSNRSNWKGPTLPVENVSWDDSKAFSDKVGLELPTEAQWERACRAGTATAYGFGNDASQLGSFDWYDANSGMQTHPVGEKQANSFGLFDIHGNVWEWCLDGYDWYPAGGVMDPTGPQDASGRILRGGSWWLSAGWARSALRFGYVPGFRSNYLGFRPAKTVPTE